MSRKIPGLLLIALLCLLPARTGKCQDDSDNSSRRAPTLGERLEHFRDEILGEPRTKRNTNDNSNNQQPNGNRPANGQSGNGQQADSSGKQQGQNPDDGHSANGSQNPYRERTFQDRNGQPLIPSNPKRPASVSPEYQTVPVPRMDPAAKSAPGSAAAGKLAEPTPTPAAAVPGESTRRQVPPVRAEVTPAPAPVPRPHTTLDRPTTLEERLSAARKAAPVKPAAKSEAAEQPAARVARVKTGSIMREPTDTSAEKLPEHSIKKVPTENVLFSGQSPVLSVEAAGPRKIMIGREAAFEVKVRNAGDAAANNVSVLVNVPAYAELAGSQTSSGAVRAPGGTEHREPLEWKIARLEAHSRETMTLRLIPHKSIPLDLAVQWTCSPDVSQTLVEVQEPKLMMALAGPEEILYGKSKMYKLTISNPGNGDAENVLVTLQPIGRATEAAASHRLGTVRAGESKAIEVELTARQSGNLTIRAQAFADGGLRAEAAEQVLVRRATLRIETEAPRVKYAGTTSVYRVRVTNNGNATAQNVRLSALLPPDAKYVSGDAAARLESNHGKVNWTAGNLQPGMDRVFEMQCSLLAPGDNLVQFNAIADDDVSGAATSSTRVEAMADLKLEVHDPQGPVPVGEDAVYEVLVHNRGTKSAEGIELVVFFSEGLEATAVQGGGHEIGVGQVVFKPISVLQAGGDSVFRIHTKADRGGTHVFRAEVVCQSLQSKLAAEQTTRFYGEDSLGDAEKDKEKAPARHSFDRAERREVEGDAADRR